MEEAKLRDEELEVRLQRQMGGEDGGVSVETREVEEVEVKLMEDLEIGKNVRWWNISEVEMRLEGTKAKTNCKVLSFHFLQIYLN